MSRMNIEDELKAWITRDISKVEQTKSRRKAVVLLESLKGPPASSVSCRSHSSKISRAKRKRIHDLSLSSARVLPMPYESEEAKSPSSAERDANPQSSSVHNFPIEGDHAPVANKNKSLKLGFDTCAYEQPHTNPPRSVSAPKARITSRKSQTASTRSASTFRSERRSQGSSVIGSARTRLMNVLQPKRNNGKENQTEDDYKTSSPTGINQIGEDYYVSFPSKRSSSSDRLSGPTPITGNVIHHSLSNRCQQFESNSSLNRVTDLLWTGNNDGGKYFYGRYSGPVNSHLQPHGEGIIILNSNASLKFFGTWRDGCLVTSLMKEDEKRHHGEANKLPRSDNTTRSLDCKIPFNVAPQPSSRNSAAQTPPLNRSMNSAFTIVSRPSGVFFSGPPGRKSGDKTPRQEQADGRPDQPNRVTKTTSAKRSIWQYKLGEVVRTPCDMIIHRSNDAAVQSASLLQKFDQAFLKRSTGLWTCAVLADRALQPVNASASNWYTKEEIEDHVPVEESLLFVINGDGATKIIKKKKWDRFVRRMNNQGDFRKDGKGGASCN